MLVEASAVLQMGQDPQKRAELTTSIHYLQWASTGMSPVSHF